MSAIITLTFSPCIDKSFSVPSLIPEKKLSCSYPLIEPGGGGVNVARALHRLGSRVTAIFPSGGYTGPYFEHLLDIERVSYISINATHETRENVIVLEETTGLQYRFGMPGSFLSNTEWSHCLRALDGMEDVGFLVVSGSLPAGVPADIYGRLSEIAAKKNMRLILDCPGAELQRAAGKGVYLMKPSLHELAVLCGAGSVLPEDVPALAKILISKDICDILLVSTGEAGAVVATKDKCLLITAPPVKKKSTVGAGDCLVAGVLHYLSKHKPLEEAAAYGVACGTAATLQPGTALFCKEEVEKLYGRVTVQEKC
jgi:6-phosphofructokinase 2